MSSIPITILITTKDRVEDLKTTLETLRSFVNSGGNIIICDDGSEDNTSNVITGDYPGIKLVRNEKNMGLIYSRNMLLNMVNTPYAISLDDDSNFIGLDSFGNIISHFSQNENCGVIAFRIYWGVKPPKNTISQEATHRVKSFVGCGHAWRIKAWKDIPNYPDWFNFYGEEDFASFHLFKKGWQVHYLPDVLVHHRVNIKARKKDKDYTQRLRQSLRAGWYLYFIFLPWKYLPKKMGYSLWMQLQLKVFRGDQKALNGLLLAIKDLLFNLRKVIKISNRLTRREYEAYSNILETKIYWNPEN